MGINVLTERHYLQASLALPLVVPLFIGLTAALTSSEVTDGFAVFFLFSLVLGGIPYLVLVAVVLFWSRHQSVNAIRRLSYFAPVILVIATAGLSFTALAFGISAKEIAAFVVIFSVYALLLGYFYVFIVNFLYEVLFGK